MDLSKTGKRIKACRTKMKPKMTQSALAEQIGISDKRTISDWENGSIPKLENILLLSKALKCEPEYLLGCIEHPDITTSWIAEEISLSGISIDLLRGLKKECDSRTDGDVLNDEAHMTRFLVDCEVIHTVREQAEYGANETMISLAFRLVGALKILAEYEGVQKVGDKLVFGEEMLSAEELLKLKRNPPERYRMAKWEKEMCVKNIGELIANNISDSLQDYIYTTQLLEKLERSEKNGNL